MIAILKVQDGIAKTLPLILPDIAFIYLFLLPLISNYKTQILFNVQIPNICEFVHKSVLHVVPLPENLF